MVELGVETDSLIDYRQSRLQTRARTQIRILGQSRDQIDGEWWIYDFDGLDRVLFRWK